METLDAFLGDAPIGFALLDRDLRYVRVNRSLAALDGVGVEEHAGRALKDVVPEFAEMATRSLQYVLETGNAVANVEVSGEYPAGSGKQSYFLLNYSPVRSGTAITGVALTVTDVTGLKQAQQSLQSERSQADAVVRRLNYHLENSPAAVTEWDKNFVLTYWSAQAEKIFGWKEEEVVGKTPYQFGFIHGEDVFAVRDVNRRLNKGIEVRSISCNRNYGKDGSVHYCEWYNSALSDENGEISSIFSIVFDVTDRYRAEEALRSREEFLRLAFEASGMWSWEVNPVTDEVRWPELGPAVYAASFPERGTTFSEWLNKCVHPDDRERVRREHLRAINEGGIFDVQFRVVKPDGSTHWVYNRGSLFRDSDGQPARVLGVGMDITARRESEKALHDSEERLRFAFEAAYMGAWDWNVQTGALKWYGNNEAMFGVAAGTFEGRFDGFVSRIHPEDRQRVLMHLSDVAAKREPYRDEFRVRWSDGSDHWVLSQGRFYYDEKNEPLRLVGVNMDLTARKLREESLISSEARLRLAMQAARAGCWEWDVNANKSVWSDELWAILGLEPNSVEPSHDAWLRTVHPDDREFAAREVHAAVAERRDVDTEYRCIAPDGSIRWIAALGKLLFDDGGKPTKMVGINLDVTDRKRSEEALRMNDRLAATGRMAASLAHEINNPLASVTNLLYLLEQRSLDDTARQFVSVASSELGRVAHITKNILGLYRESPVPVSVNLCEILENVVGFYKPKIDASGVRVQADYRAIGSVQGFPGELRQVFSNLVANSLEAMNGPGRISIRITASNNGRGHGVAVTIADNGPGIPRRIKTKVFEPFFTTKGEKGTGLGLWITQEIIRKHGGAIRVRTRTEPGRSGTVFRVFLPGDITREQISSSIPAAG